MIRRAIVLLAVWGMCVFATADAADLPAIAAKKNVATGKIALKHQRRANQHPRIVATEPIQSRATRKAVRVPLTKTNNDMDLVWVLDPLVANSDGAKQEDSASVEANLVVTEAGSVSQSTMVIELSGHVVKTARTTARLDIRIGNSHRTVSWHSDNVQSGKFAITLDAPLTAGKLPDYFPVSALAFVTKDGKEGAAMISLEKVVVRVSKIQLVGEIKDPATDEVTGSISAN